MPAPKLLFPGRSSWPLDGSHVHGDMLDEIFNILGTPFQDACYVELPDLERYVARPGTSLRAAIPVEASQPGLDLAEGMLQFFPQKRLTADAALECGFFKDCRAPKCSDERPPAPMQQLDLGFDDSCVNTECEIRREMRRTVNRFRASIAGDSEDGLKPCCPGQTSCGRSAGTESSASHLAGAPAAAAAASAGGGTGPAAQGGQAGATAAVGHAALCRILTVPTHVLAHACRSCCRCMRPTVSGQTAAKPLVGREV